MQLRSYRRGTSGQRVEPHYCEQLAYHVSGGGGGSVEEDRGVWGGECVEILLDLRKH